MARSGDLRITLTGTKPVPKEWFPPLMGLKVLGLAASGGQQAPLLAAAGAIVTVLDNSPAQLGRDRMVAEREGLSLETVEGDMADLSCFKNSSFDLIVHPVSNVFVPDVKPVWREAARVLKIGGALFSGMTNPAVYLFDPVELKEHGVLKAVRKLPYSDIEHLSEEAKKELIDRKLAFEFSHTLQDLLGGQMEAGFSLEGFYEDNFEGSELDPLSKLMPLSFATRAIKRR
jgi:ubiquinone/menaquinone biosynthesis C-methylase UbiE